MSIWSVDGGISIIKHCSFMKKENQYKREIVQWCSANMPVEHYSFDETDKETWSLFEFSMKDVEDKVLGIREKIIFLTKDKKFAVLAKVVWGGEYKEHPYDTIDDFFHAYTKKDFDL